MLSQRERRDPILGLRSTIQQDMAANPQNAKAKLLMISFRFAHLAAALKYTHRLLWILSLPYLIWYRVTFEWVLGMELPARTRVGPGLKVMHGQGLVVNYMTLIGSNCTLRQSTTIGSKIFANGEPGPSPVLGDRVDVGSNVVILGNVRIGDDAVIGAGSVVVRDVPEGGVVVGNPARLLRAKATPEPVPADAGQIV